MVKEEIRVPILHRMPKSRYLKRKYLIKFPILMGYDKQVKEIFSTAS